MNIKAYFLLASLWGAPALAMEEGLTAENIVNHPQFIEAKRGFEEIGGSIKVWPNRIFIEVRYENGAEGQAVHFDHPRFWHEVESFYEHSLAWKTHPLELKAILPKSLRGLLILDMAERYQAGDQLVVDIVSNLPEDSKKLVLKLQGHV